MPPAARLLACGFRADHVSDGDRELALERPELVPALDMHDEGIACVLDLGHGLLPI
jgi:hypothetical protein